MSSLSIIQNSQQIHSVKDSIIQTVSNLQLHIGSIAAQARQHLVDWRVSVSKKTCGFQFVKILLFLCYQGSQRINILLLIGDHYHLGSKIPLLRVTLKDITH